jgi:hypothetical protein
MTYLARPFYNKRSNVQDKLFNSKAKARIGKVASSGTNILAMVKYSLYN